MNREKENCLDNKWNANLYDNKHQFVSKYGSDLIKLLAPKKGELILDLGCGTGDLTNEIYQSGSDIIGVDSSEEMIKKASNKYPNIKFKIMDAKELDFEKKFDGVFSNAVLHWIKSPEKVLQSIKNVLKQNGRFVAEFGGEGNVKLITDTIIDTIREHGYSFEDDDFPWYFPSIGQYATLMERIGFRVTYAIHFDRPTKLADSKDGLKDWIDMFGRNLLIKIPKKEQEKIIEEVEKELSQKLIRNKNWFADYKRIRVIGIKE